jgi:predicted O-methyltransferase YrrM
LLECESFEIDIAPLFRNEWVDGNVAVHELDIICRLVRHAQPRRIFEIGTFNGRTTANMAACCAADIYTLNLPVSGTDLGICFRGNPRVTQLLGDSATFDYAPYLGAMDFVFVDGDHSREYAASDTAWALRLAAPGATILWHDYLSAFPGVDAVLDELAQRHPVRRIKHTTLAWLKVEGRLS